MIVTDVFSKLQQSFNSVQEPVDLQNVPDDERGQTTGPSDVRIVEMPAPLVKGEMKRLGSFSASGLSNSAVDFRGFNAAAVRIIVGGENPSATIAMQGGNAEQGNFLTLPDPAATQTVTADTLFYLVVGAPYLKANLTVSSGTFVIEVTPFVAGFTPPTAANGMYIQPDTTAEFNISDRAARDLGKADIASLDQYTPVDGRLPVTMGSITAGRLQATKQTRDSVTCTDADTDYDMTEAIPEAATYIVVWAAAIFYIAVGEDTSSTIGIPVPANSPQTFPIVRGGDNLVHVQSPSAGTVVYVGYLED